MHLTANQRSTRFTEASGHCLEVREVKSVQQLNLMQCEPSKDTQLWQWSSVQAA
eukprot:m.173243 g.173243  ORF g.173243 m.173243 type:complete len:54 (+) comp24311_c0_seq4:2240-2401(+)